MRRAVQLPGQAALDQPRAESKARGGLNGGTVALLVAPAPELAGRVSVVAAIAPFTDLEKVMMLATTGTYPGDRGPESYHVPPSLAIGLAFWASGEFGKQAYLLLVWAGLFALFRGINSFFVAFATAA